MVHEPLDQERETDPAHDAGASRAHFEDIPKMTVSIEALRQTFAASDDTDILPPVHPGEVLRVEFMTPLGLSSGAVAKALNLPRSRIERIVKEEIGISTDTALRLARYFRTSHQFWLNLQTHFESETLLAEIGPQLAGIQPVRPVRPEAA